VFSSGPALRSVVAIFAVSLIAPPAFSQEDRSNEALKALDRLWEARREMATCVEYEASGTHTIAKDAFLDDGIDLREDLSFPVKLACLFDFPTNRYRIDNDDKVMNVSDKRLASAREVWTYVPGDLRVHHVSVSEDRVVFPEYGIGQPDFSFQDEKWYPVLTFTKLPMLLAHGHFAQPSASGDRQRIAPLTSDQFELKGSARLEVLDCLVLLHKGAGGSAREYWFDPATGLCRRVVRSQGAHIDEQLEIEYDESGDVPALLSWRVTGFSAHKPSEFYRGWEYTVDMFDPQAIATKEKFTQEPLPGMFVRDAKAKRGYYLTASGEEAPPMQVVKQQRNLRFVWTVIVGSVVTLIAALLLMIPLWRRGREKAARAE